MTLSLYWHTLRHLRPAQVAARATKRWRRLDLTLPANQRVRTAVGEIGFEPWRKCALGDDGRFTFLNETHRLSREGGWNKSGVAKLWLYNLHYFDWINALDASARCSSVANTVLGWMTRWIAENPPGRGNGWEPYPLSLRIVNWIKWLVRRPQIPSCDARAIQRSLELQAHVLSQCLETDIPGNHLLANAKALTFAGCYFEGSTADDWFEQGVHVLSRELDAQVLMDGGYFELSPMYHATVLEDVLDLVALQRAYPERPWNGVARRRLDRVAESMLAWLTAMTHPDGQIGLFNDAAWGIAPDLAMLTHYAQRLGLPVRPRAPTNGIGTLSASGFVRVDRGPSVAILDVGRIGPDHLPGHAHADTLTFEWSLGDRRVIVNSGTSLYGEGPERLRQRGTAAHNTVVVDDRDSSEVWKGFRVARRARPYDVTVESSSEPWTVSAAHDGYRRLPGDVVHRRRWEFESNKLRVIDRVHGRHGIARAYFHFDPGLEARLCSDSIGVLCVGSGPIVTFAVGKGRPRLTESTYHPEFGHSIRNQCLVIELEQAESMIAFGFDA